jgi:two-component system, NarL family, sensor kinase
METEKIIFQATLLSIVLLTALFLFFIFLIKSSTNKRKADKASFELALKEKELEQMNAVIVGQESERVKIASNLHDEVGSIMSMAQRNLEFAITKLDSDVSLKEELQTSLSLLEQSMTKIRSISNGMLPHFLMKFGLIKTLQRLTNQTEATLGNTCHFTTNCPNNFKLEQQNEIQLYAILQELVNNILKHAHPQSIQIILLQQAPILELTISHDGVAINQSEYEHLLLHSEGVGLASIVNRLTMLKGQISYVKTQQGGFVTVEIPF